MENGKRYTFTFVRRCLAALLLVCIVLGTWVDTVQAAADPLASINYNAGLAWYNTKTNQKDERAPYASLVKMTYVHAYGSGASQNTKIRSRTEMRKLMPLKKTYTLGNGGLCAVAPSYKTTYKTNKKGQKIPVKTELVDYVLVMQSTYYSDTGTKADGVTILPEDLMGECHQIFLSGATRKIKTGSTKPLGIGVQAYFGGYNYGRDVSLDFTINLRASKGANLYYKTTLVGPNSTQELPFHLLNRNGGVELEDIEALTGYTVRVEGRIVDWACKSSDIDPNWVDETWAEEIANGRP